MGVIAYMGVMDFKFTNILLCRVYLERGWIMKLKIKNKKLGLKIVFKLNEYILSTLNEKGEILKILEYIEHFKEVKEDDKRQNKHIWFTVWAIQDK